MNQSEDFAIPRHEIFDASCARLQRHIREVQVWHEFRLRLENKYLHVPIQLAPCSVKWW